MKPGGVRISKRTVESLKTEKDTVFWDSELTGFGVRVYPTGSKYYVVQTRAEGKPGKRVTIGRHGMVAADEARRRAALVISRIKSGEEPLKQVGKPTDGPTVEKLAYRWLEEYVEVRCKPKTREMYRVMVNRHLLPALGKDKALSIDHARVTELHHSLRSTPSMANQVVGTLSRIWDYSENGGELPEGSNPCRRAVKFRRRRRERFLSEAEFHRLGRVLSEVEVRGDVSVHAVSAIRLLLLTGCRKNEIMKLRWDEVDLEARELNLSDSRTGRRAVPLSPEAGNVLSGIPRLENNPYVIPGRVEGRPMSSLDNHWHVVRKLAGLHDVRIHDLRHSFASRALALGESLPAIGKLLGHARIETTAHYAHLTQDSVRESAERIADSIAADILMLSST